MDYMTYYQSTRETKSVYRRPMLTQQEHLKILLNNIFMNMGVYFKGIRDYIMTFVKK